MENLSVRSLYICRLILHLHALSVFFCFSEVLEEIHWRTAERTFPLFVQLFDFPDFHYQLVLGFAASVGSVTENTVSCPLFV